MLLAEMIIELFIGACVLIYGGYAVLAAGLLASDIIDNKLRGKPRTLLAGWPLVCVRPVYDENRQLIGYEEVIGDCGEILRGRKPRHFDAEGRRIVQVDAYGRRFVQFGPVYEPKGQAADRKKAAIGKMTRKAASSEHPAPREPYAYPCMTGGIERVMASVGEGRADGNERLETA